MSEVWIDAQVQWRERYAAVLLSLNAPIRPNGWRSPALVLSRRESVLLRLAARPRTRWLHPAAGVLPVLRDIDPHVFHAHFGPDAWLWLPAAQAAKRPVVTSLYGFDASHRRYTSPRWTRRYSALFAATAAVLLEGPAMASRVIRLGCPEQKVHVVRLPFLPPDVTVKDHGGPRRFAVALAGRLIAKKGFDIGLRAFARAFRGAHARLLVIGDGPLAAPLRTLARELGVDDQVVWTGAVPLEAFIRTLMSCELVAFPSLVAPDGNSEGGAPLTIPLVQWIGLPAVITDHDDLPWAAAPGTPTVPSGDEEALADAMRSVWDEGRRDSTDLRRRLVDARAFVEEAYAPQRLTRQREAVYDRARSLR